MKFRLIFFMLILGFAFSMFIFVLGYFMPDLLRDPSYTEAVESGKYPENVTVLGKEFINTRITTVPVTIDNPNITVEKNILHDKRYNEDDIDSRWTYEVTVRNTGDSPVWMNKHLILKSKGSYCDHEGTEFTNVFGFLSKNDEFFLLETNDNMTYHAKGITAFGETIAIQDFEGVSIVAFDSIRPTISAELTTLGTDGLSLRIGTNGKNIILADIESITYSYHSGKDLLEVKVANREHDCDAIFVAAGLDQTGQFFARNSSAMKAGETMIFYLDPGENGPEDVTDVAVSVYHTMVSLS